MRRISGFLAILGMLIAALMVFFYAPIEKTMGIPQKIFYFHVSSAWVGFLAFFVTFVSSIVYLVKRTEGSDRLAASSAELGLVFTTIVLVTGPIWGKVAWGAWWTWDPRLTTTLILWFLYAAYLVLRSGVATQAKRVFSAVFGIIAFIDVPIVWVSIRWWRTIHPVVLRASGFDMAPEMVVTLLVSVAAFTLLFVHYLLVKYDLEDLSSRLDELQTRMGG